MRLSTISAPPSSRKHIFVVNNRCHLESELISDKIVYFKSFIIYNLKTFILNKLPKRISSRDEQHPFKMWHSIHHHIYTLKKENPNKHS